MVLVQIKAFKEEALNHKLMLVAFQKNACSISELKYVDIQLINSFWKIDDIDL